MRNKPRIRFKGFTEDWEQRELSSLTKYIGTGKSRFVIKEFGEYAILGSTNVIGYDDAYDYDGNFILTARVGANAGQLYRYSGKVKITDNTVFLMSDRSQFIYYALTHFDLRRLSFGTGQPLVKSSELQKLKLCVPVSKSEQEKIGEIFNNIDNIITLHQRKLEKLKLAKKALLQKLFPKNGSKFPELRFKGFADAWEQRKLNDFVTIRRGLTYKPSDIAEKGIRVLRSSNIDEDQFIKSNDDVFVNIDAVNIPFAKNGDILITSANGSSRLVGKHTIINDIAENSTVHGGFMLLAESHNPLFTDALLSSNWYKRFINTYVAGGNGAIGNLSKSDLESQSVMIPSEHEQTKIGQWYGSINQLITLHQRKLDKLQEVKKGLLQKMFV